MSHNGLSVSQLWKEPTVKFTWKHVVMFVYWAVTLIPMLLIVMAGQLSDWVDGQYGVVRRWANADAYWHPPKEKDYQNADRDSITQPYDDIAYAKDENNRHAAYTPSMIEVVTDAVLGPKSR